eukprot:SAG22_NODE_75_length_22256_cov_45.062960_19_plen_65_part_00
MEYSCTADPAAACRPAVRSGRRRAAARFHTGVATNRAPTVCLREAMACGHGPGTLTLPSSASGL